MASGDIVVTSANQNLENTLDIKTAQLVEAQLVIAGADILQTTKQILRSLNPKGYATGDLSNRYMGVSTVKKNRNGFMAIRIGSVKEGQRKLYAEVLEVGRKPGKKMPPSEAIKGWLEVKGISPPAGMTLDQYAFVIARKIGKKGTLALGYMEKTAQIYRSKHGASSYSPNSALGYRRG